MEDVDRSNHNAKINGLINESPHLIDIMELMSVLKNGFRFFNSKVYNNFRDLSTFISLLINLSIMWGLAYAVSDSSTVQYHGEVFSIIRYDIFLEILGYCQLVTSSLMILFWMVLNAPIILKKKWRERMAANSGKDDEIDHFEDD